MIDLLYIFGALAFFGLMWAYTRACERLGAGLREEESQSHEL
jgi:hypothetical protein